MLDIWMSGIARAGGVEAPLHRVAETLPAPRRSSRPWLRPLLSRLIAAARQAAVRVGPDLVARPG